ncbi:MAG: hypothetical protein V3V31_05725 [Methylococcales bacterium]
MKKLTLLGSVLTAVLFSGSTFGEASRASSVLKVTSGLIQDQDAESGETESGATCDATYATSAGGFTLCARLFSGASGRAEHFTVTNAPAVTGVQFLQVVN